MNPFLFPSATLENPEWIDVSADKIISGNPKTAFTLAYTSADGAFYAGVWQSTPGKWRVSYHEDEFCTLIEGTVTLHPDSGTPDTYTAPASFMIPAGFNGAWESVTDVRKYFVIYDRAP